jgi:hypothetical protein
MHVYCCNSWFTHYKHIIVAVHLPTCITLRRVSVVGARVLYYQSMRISIWVTQVSSMGLIKPQRLGSASYPITPHYCCMVSHRHASDQQAIRPYKTK